MTAIPRWLPNAISALRIAMVPGWVVCAEIANRTAADGGDHVPWRHGAAVVLVAIGLSDVVDGTLARRFHLQSRLGATLDAVADKLAQVVLFTYLALRTGPAFAAVPWWFLALLIARDAVLLVGWCVVRWRAGAVHVVHEAHGKLTSLFLFGLLLACSFGFDASSLTVPLVLLAAWTAASAALYVRDGWRQLPRQAH